MWNARKIANLVIVLDFLALPWAFIGLRALEPMGSGGFALTVLTLPVLGILAIATVILLLGELLELRLSQSMATYTLLLSAGLACLAFVATSL